MKRVAWTAAVVVSLAAASLASAEVKTHPTAKVQMDVPAGWKLSGTPDQSSLVDPKDEVGFVLLVLDAADLKKAADELDARLAKMAKDVKWADKTKQVQLNGMDAVANKGTATINGKAADIAVLIVKTPSGKMLLVFGGVDSAKKAVHKAEVEAFINSIKPVK
jgi:predicted Zn-dependent protease